MKTMKKLIVLILAIVLAGTMLTGCSKADDGKYVVGICQLVEHEALDAATAGFKQAVIDELGEENVKFDYQNAQGDAPTCSIIVNQFVSNQVDLIMANATPALQAAASATDTIPILGTSVTEYGVALNLEKFEGVVGKNISGTSDLAPLKEQAAVLKEWFPDAKTVGILYCSSEANSKYQVDVMTKELAELGIEAEEYPFTDSNDIFGICTNAAANSDVIYVPTDNTVADNTGIVYSVCSEAKVPVIAGEEGICKGCGIATLSISYYDLGYTTGQMAVKVLKGQADISTMEIGFAPATKKYNAQLCEEFGIEPVDGYEVIE